MDSFLKYRNLATLGLWLNDLLKKVSERVYNLLGPYRAVLECGCMIAIFLQFQASKGG